MIFIAGYRWRERAEGGTYFPHHLKTETFEYAEKAAFSSVFLETGCPGVNVIGD